MKQKNNPYLLTICLMITALLFTFLGYYWNSMYDTSMKFDMDIPPLTKAMQGIHDELYLPPSATQASINIDTLIVNSGDELSISGQINEFMQKCINFQNDIAKRTKKADTLEFSTVTDEYFNDACFIGDSRTVGISQYSGIKNATFLCKTSLSIYDFDKPKITYESKKTSIQQVLSDKKFAKIYLMVGINECGIGTPESFFETYKSVVEEIRFLQPEAIIYLEGNLLVTDSKSNDKTKVTNENIITRNRLISTLANQNDIFYIDINESELCENGALISAYTWDQVHIKAQYYSIWKDFLLSHAIEKTIT